MSCCPPAPEIIQGGSADADRPSQDTAILPGESVECYMKRAENPSGLKDDLTGYEKDKISNTSIPVGPNAEIDVTFTLTPGSTRVVTQWEIAGTLPAGVTFNGTTGKLSGQVQQVDHGKTFTLVITATDGTGQIDSRSFTFVPVLANRDNSIQFVHPLPGSIVTSKFGPRVHPVKGYSSPHKGADFAYPGGKIGDVVAAADGTVVDTLFQAGGAGKYIILDHRTASGQPLCQTVYMHLNEFYVAKGQKVAAGQKIGREGNTGVGTGPHLHFECRIVKNGTPTWVDPVPLIRGTLGVAQQTNPDNTAVTGTVVAQASNAALTAPDAAARSSSCAAFSPTYPNPPNPSGPPTPTGWAPPAPTGSVFDKAWYFVMKHEVGPHWETAPQFSPGDAELDAGLYETTLQRKKVGYVRHPADPGGETKFGVAQGPNPRISVANLDYDNAKKTGYNGYWLTGPNAYESSKPRTAVMLMDMFYLHGKGNVTGDILPRANISALDDEAACRALHASQQLYFRNLVAAKPSRSVFLKGWLKRSDELLAYALGLTF